MYYRNAQAAVVVYDITKSVSESLKTQLAGSHANAGLS
jgi:hypothetical protein